MLHRDMPFGLARYRGLAEPFHDPLPRDHHLHHHRLTHRTGSGHATRSSSSRHGSEDDTQSHSGILPEDVIVIILGHLSVAEIMVIRRVSGGCSIFSPSESWNSNDFFKCSKWFKRLSENRQIWLDFILQPVFPLPACDAQLSRLPIEALEAHVRRQFELARLWSPPEPNTPIRVSRSRRLAMPNNESLTAMSSMDSWVAVATDLGGIYVCAPFGKGSVKWIRVLSLSVEITKLRVTVWSEPAGERVGVLWAGCLNVQGAPLRFVRWLVGRVYAKLFTFGSLATNVASPLPWQEIWLRHSRVHRGAFCLAVRISSRPQWWIYAIRLRRLWILPLANVIVLSSMPRILFRCLCIDR